MFEILFCNFFKRISCYWDTGESILEVSHFCDLYRFFKTNSKVTFVSISEKNVRIVF